MKIFFKALCAAVLLSVIFSMIPFSADCKNLSDDVFRLHILANSDSDADQELKLKVRDRVLKYTESLYKSAPDKPTAEALTAEKLQSIADVAADTVRDEGYDYPVKAEINNIGFDTRYYGSVTMPAGNYDALRITIGEGRGHNWWCVMYPSLCVGAATDYDELRKKTTDSEYGLVTEGYNFQFKIVEYFQNFCSLFS